MIHDLLIALYEICATIISCNVAGGSNGDLHWIYFGNNVLPGYYPVVLQQNGLPYVSDLKDNWNRVCEPCCQYLFERGENSFLSKLLQANTLHFMFVIEQNVGFTD